MPAREQVFVVDRDAFFGGGEWPQGYHRLDDAPRFLAQAFARGRFVDRDQAEATPAWKQWIPYCMLRCQGGVLVVQRTKKGGERRLHESYSIGLGGHIEPVDASAAAADIPASSQVADDQVAGAARFFRAALHRELHEELRLPDTATGWPEPRLLGLINDDSTEVGKVHAGLAYALDLELPLAAAKQAVGIREISKMHGAFTSLVEFAELWQTPSQFESWSQFLVQAEIVGAMGGRSWNGPTSAKNDTSPE